jgi:hypothetical protein
MKNSNYPIGNQTRDILVCSAVPQPTVWSRTTGCGIGNECVHLMWWISVFKELSILLLKTCQKPTRFVVYYRKLIKTRLKSENAYYYSVQNLYLPVKTYKDWYIEKYNFSLFIWVWTLVAFIVGERRLRTVEIKVLRRIFEPKRNKETSERRRKSNNELYAPHKLLFGWLTQKTEMGRAWSTYERDACRILVGKPEGRRQLGRARRRYADSIKINFQEVVWGARTGFNWLRIETYGGLLWMW